MSNQHFASEDFQVVGGEFVHSDLIGLVVPGGKIEDPLGLAVGLSLVGITFVTMIFILGDRDPIMLA